MTHQASRRWILTAIGLALSLGVAMLPLGDWGRSYSGFGKLWGGDVLWWAAAIVILVYVTAVERRGLSSIGMRRPSGWDIGWALIFAVITFVGIGVITTMIFPALHLHVNQATYGSIVYAPLSYRVALVTRAAVCEEILFRGYPLQRLEEWTGSAWLAGLITWALFTYAHLSSWGTAQLIVAGFGGAILTVLFLWRRNLWANMLTHWLVDGAAFIMVPLLMPHH